MEALAAIAVVPSFVKFYIMLKYIDLEKPFYKFLLSGTYNFSHVLKAFFVHKHFKT